MGTTEDILNRLKQEAFSGGLAKASTETLEGYAAALCHSQAFSVFGTHEFQQVCETVRIHLLRAHIKTLQTHITDLNTKNTTIQKWVIALAIAALISAVIQTVVIIRAEVRAESQVQSTVSVPQTQAAQEQISIQNQTPSIPPIEPASK